MGKHDLALPVLCGEVRSFLGRALDPLVTASFLYGSVAAGTAGRGSDLDCFVLTSSMVPERARAAAGHGFEGLQRRLGFSPDPAYPIEIFSVQQSWAALGGRQVRAALAAARAGQLLDDDRLMSADETEVLRALLNRRVVVIASPMLDDLTAAAGRLLDEVAARAGQDRGRLARALGVRHLLPMLAGDAS